MKRLLLVLSLLASMALSGCMLTTTTRAAAYGPPPAAYVYAYPNGCWADDVWYAPCPWTVGPSYGYYTYWHGGYYYQPGVRWEFRHGYPPPRHWRHEYRPAHPYGGHRR